MLLELELTTKLVVTSQQPKILLSIQRKTDVCELRDRWHQQARKVPVLETVTMHFLPAPWAGVLTLLGQFTAYRLC